MAEGHYSARVFNALIFFAYCGIMSTAPLWGSIVTPRISTMPDDVVCDNACYGYFTIYRLGYAFCVYHILQLLMLLGVKDSDDSRASLQGGFWYVKPGVLLLLAVGSFFVPYGFFIKMFWPTLIAGIVFLAIQGVLLVDLSFGWAERLLEQAERGKAGAKAMMIGSTFFINTTVLAVIVAIFSYFDSNLERGLVAVNAVLIVVMNVCSVLPSVQEANPSAGIFQASLLGIYSMFVLLSAFINDPNQSSGMITIATAMPKLGMAISGVNVIFAFFAIAQAAFSVGSSLARMGPSSKGSLDTSDEAAGRYNYSLFHANFALAALFTVLYMTYWQGVDISSGKIKMTYSLVGYWSRVLASWGVGGLYIWAVYAPIILEDRNF